RDAASATRRRQRRLTWRHRRAALSSAPMNPAEPQGMPVSPPTSGSSSPPARAATRIASLQVAWLFPGQGSQTVGMGKALLAASPAARDVFARADAALGEPLSRLILEGPEAELTLTANLQPALVTMSAAVVAAVRERHPDLPAPRFAAGHSLGEYSALV